MFIWGYLGGIGISGVCVVLVLCGVGYWGCISVYNIFEFNYLYTPSDDAILFFSGGIRVDVCITASLKTLKRDLIKHCLSYKDK